MLKEKFMRDYSYCKGKQKYNNDQMGVQEAARLMHKNPYFVSLGLQQGRFDFGYAVLMKDGTWGYYINRNKFYECTGIIPEGEEE